MRSSVAATVLFLIAACARAPGPVTMARGDRHDQAYLALRLRQEGCRPELRAQCCPVIKARLDEALAREEMATVAVALDTLAIACPDRRSDALAALDHQPRPVETPGAARVTVEYSAHIGASDRLYWASAFIDGKQLAGTALPPGPHAVEVEMHVMTAAGTQNDALFRIRAREELVLEAGKPRTFQATLRRSETPGDKNPFSLQIAEIVGPPQQQPPQPAPAADPNASPPARTKLPGMGKYKHFPRPRLPSELSRGELWWTMLHVCVQADGRVDSTRPILEPPHPRMLGVLIDALAHAEYVPLSVDGKVIPYCYPLRITVSPS
jgi:hypothetical protein